MVALQHTAEGRQVAVVRQGLKIVTTTVDMRKPKKSSKHSECTTHCSSATYRMQVIWMCFWPIKWIAVASRSTSQWFTLSRNLSGTNSSTPREGWLGRKTRTGTWNLVHTYWLRCHAQVERIGGLSQKNTTNQMSVHVRRKRVSGDSFCKAVPYRSNSSWMNGRTLCKLPKENNLQWEQVWQIYSFRTAP